MLTKRQYRGVTCLIYLSLGVPLLASMWWLDSLALSGPIPYLIELAAGVLYAYLISFWPKSYSAFVAARANRSVGEGRS